MSQAKIDNDAVDLLASAMKSKLAYKRSERGGGYCGWEYMPEDELWERLILHVFKARKDPVDVADYCAMIHANRLRNKP